MADCDFIDRVPANATLDQVLDALKWDEHGLVAIVQQDVPTRQVVGLAFSDRSALAETLRTGFMHYYSRSRKKLWKKGEQSGHVQKLVELRVDCDGDALLARIRQVKANCHMGYFSCFSFALKRSTNGGISIKTAARRRFDPKTVYKKK
jgi:phosphoribosyl-AMP cyclohydrolase